MCDFFKGALRYFSFLTANPYMFKFSTKAKYNFTFADIFLFIKVVVLRPGVLGTVHLI